MASEFRLSNAEIVIQEDISQDQLIDAFMGNRAYLPYLVAINKADLGLPSNLTEFVPAGLETVFISAQTGKNLELLKQKIWEKLEFILIYLKKEEIDYQQPFILKKGLSLANLLEKISICTKDSFKKAKIYGAGAKFPGQEVSLSFIPEDETVVQFLA